MKRVKLPIKCLDTIALGAGINSTMCACSENECVMSDSISGFEDFRGKVSTLIENTGIEPKIIACDLHPTYNSTIFAKEFAVEHKARLVQIQHHKAHVAGAAAEHKLTDYVGIAMDGLGYGDDGTIWGGEVFDVSGGIEFKRVGHLERQIQIGGDSATIYPKKMLFSILSKILSEKEIAELKLFDPKESGLYSKMLKDKFNIVYTSSSGRVLDAVSAFLGVCDKRTYDGEPAIELEKNSGEAMDIEICIRKEGDCSVLMTTPLFEFLLENRGIDRGVLGATAQMYLAKGLYSIAEKIGKPIVFCGGVAHNKIISGFMRSKGVFMNKEVSCGDDGICYGQAYLANLQLQDYTPLRDVEINRLNSV